jgi:hypothetical protein
MSTKQQVMGDSLARGLAKKKRLDTVERMELHCQKAMEGKQSRGAIYRRLKDAIRRAGAVHIGSVALSKHNKIETFLAPGGDTNEWDLFECHFSRQGHELVRRDMGLTEHVVQRALQSGISLQELGRVLVEATVADGESGVLGPMDGWFSTADAIFRINNDRIATVIAKSVLDPSKLKLHERALAAGGWLPDLTRREW